MIDLRRKPASDDGEMTAEAFAALYGTNKAKATPRTPSKKLSRKSAKKPPRVPSPAKSPNALTLQIYEKHDLKYLEDRDALRAADPAAAAREDEYHRDFLRRATECLTPASAIFEAGAGDGSAAALFESLGFRNYFVSDAAETFLDYMVGHGLNPFKFNLLTDPYPNQFDGIYTWSTLIHFTPAEVKDILYKTFISLAPGGTCIFNLLNAAEHDGRPEGWFDGPGPALAGIERYYSFWTAEEVDKLLLKTQFRPKIIELHGGSSGKMWFNIVARKRS